MRRLKALSRGEEMSLRSEVSLVLLPPRLCRDNPQISAGARIELMCFKDALMASKGDTILVVPGWFVILTNMPWQRFLDAFKALDTKACRITWIKLVIDIFRVNEQRKYVLARLAEGIIEADFTRTEVKEEVIEHGRKLVIDGVEFTITRVARHHYQVGGMATLKFFPNGSWTIYEEVEEKTRTSTDVAEGVEWRIVDPSTRLSSILSRYAERTRSPSRRFFGRTTIFTEQGIATVFVDRVDGSIRAKVSDVGLPSEEKLLKCSRFYSIIVPKLLMREDMEGREARYAEFDVYYDGRKRTLVLNTEPPDALWFRALRRRSISTYAKRILPRGYESARDIIRKVGGYGFYYDMVHEPSRVTKVLAEFNRFISEVYEKIQNLHSKPRDIDGVGGFFEAIYARIPRRKLRIVREWIELYEKVKDLAPKTTLYVVFYGQKVYKRRLPNFVGFRIDGDSNISVLSRRVVPVSGISFRGGDFERLYRDVMNLDNLIFYQLSSRQEKLVILKDWVEEVRGRLRELGVEPATSTFKEVYDKLKELSMSKELTDNGVYLAFQFLEKLKDRAQAEVLKRVKELARVLVGLVKTGKYPEDYGKFAEAGFLESMRWVIKYAIKSRGYSIRKGVLILGDPAGVRRRVREVIQRIRGRMLALAEAVEAGFPEEYKPVVRASERLEAVAKLL